MIYVNDLSIDEYSSLRESVGWGALDKEQIKGLIDGSDFIISCRDNSGIVGAARVFWDKGYIAYISDVMVKPMFQNQGIGKKLVDECIRFVDEQLKEGWRIKIVLISSKGNEGFYEKIGFRYRPNEKYGAGMDMWRFFR